MDDADHAKELEEAERDNLIRQVAARSDHAGSETCIDCDAIIPAARRKSVPGVKRCVDCQNLRERASNGR